MNNLEVIQTIAERLCTHEALKLSTCHSTFSGAITVPRVSVELCDEAALDSFCMWLDAYPGISREFRIEGTCGFVGFGDKETEFVDSLVNSYHSTLTKLSMDLLFLPGGLLSSLSAVQHATFCTGRFDSTPSLARNEALEVLCIRDGLDAMCDDECIELGGITDAPKLRHLCIQEQDVPICLDDLPKLDKLTHLEITGCDRCPHCPPLLSDIDSVRHLPLLKTLILDSRSALLEDAVVMEALKNLEVLNLSPYGHCDLHRPSQAFVDGIRKMEKLTTFGARDLVLDRSFGSGSIETIVMSFASFIESVAAGMTVYDLPNIEKVVITEATSLCFRRHEIEWVCDLLRNAQIVVELCRENEDDDGLENESLTAWFHIASRCPHVTFCIV